jgi:subtilisin family serine protease
MVGGKLDGPLAGRVHALETADTTAADFAWPRPVKVLVHYTGDRRPLEQAGLIIELDAEPILVGTIAVKDLSRLAALDNVVSIQSNRELRMHSDASHRPQDAGQALPIPTLAPSLTGKDVIVGIIDTGVDIFHPTFIKDGSTRFLALFDLTMRQTITATPNLTANKMVIRWQPPVAGSGETRREIVARLDLPATREDVKRKWEEFTTDDDIIVDGGPLPAKPITIEFASYYNTQGDSTKLPDIFCAGDPPAAGGLPDFTVTRSGIVYSRDKINQALQQPDPDFPFRDADGHGTQVASVAAGSGVPGGGCWASSVNSGMAPDADLIVVRTPFRLSPYIQATQFLLDLGATTPKPVVINMSFGLLGGAHDGTDALDVYCDGRLSGSTRRAIVAAAGNEGAFSPLPLVTQLPVVPQPERTGGQHAFDAVGPNSQVSLGFVVDYHDRQMDIVDIWYSASSRLSFSLTAPPSAGGDSTPAIQPGPGQQTVKLGEHTIIIESSVDVGPPFHKSHITVGINPPPATGMIAVGTWTIQLREVAGTVAAFDCWLGGQDRSGRFVEELQERTRTVASPASAHHVLAVGAYDIRDNQLADFSSRGPTLEPAPVDQRVKPEVCAPGVNVLTAIRGAVAPLWFKPDDGTSFAAPYVTGLIALMFEADPTLSHDKITKKIRDTCIRPGPSVPAEDLAGWGSGRVNPTAALSPALAGEPILPAAAYPALALPAHLQAAALQRRTDESAAGRTLATLVSRHAAEVRRLVETERRVTVAWHRMHGPALLSLVLGDPDRTVLLPRTLGGKPLADGLSRLLDELARAGSTSLWDDITLFRELVLALPGARLTDLDVHAELS